jgi:hypothetical protein
LKPPALQADWAKIPIVTVTYEPPRDKNGNFTYDAGIARSYVSFFNQTAYEALSRQQQHRLLTLKGRSENKHGATSE